MFCPRWLFDACCGSATNDYLRFDMPIEMIGKKYSEAMSEDYVAIEAAFITAGIENMVLFLNEISAGESAADYALGFCYFRTAFESQGRERKIKSMFGSQLDGVKVQEYDVDKCLVAFKAYVFALRNQQTPKAPPGWSIKSREDIDLYQRLSVKGDSLLDYL
ncbi:MAG: hypothetical protein VW124_11375 [Paracoccaceae bacterium]